MSDSSPSDNRTNHIIQHTCTCGQVVSMDSRKVTRCVYCGQPACYLHWNGHHYVGHDGGLYNGKIICSKCYFVRNPEVTKLGTIHGII